jgi:hypothetical protein
MPARTRIREFIRRKPGLMILIALLAVISFRTIKPGFYLIGWDNFSSYFNQPHNLIRTLFATWREYRGLGVPSDSEVVDIFRQLFFVVGKSILPLDILDQLYYVICFVTGVFAAYSFITLALSDVFGNAHRKLLDTSAALGALMYGFNLNTLGIFYFPIVMYVTRFAALPIILSIAWVFLYRHPNRIMTAGMLIVLLLTAGSYITATVFITVAIMLGLFLLFNGSRRAALKFFVLFVALNAFWIMPFMNYSREKSPIIRLAPTYINANETQLNKSPDYYDWKRQAALYPNFFDVSYTKFTGETVPFHPLARTWDRLPDSISVYLFLILAAGGSVLIFAKIRNLRLFWVPLLWFGGLFLSMKQYSPLGKYYGYLETYIPYFSVIFRFGDTKFHPFIAFAGSIAAAYILYLSLRFLDTKFPRIRIWSVSVLLIGMMLVILPYSAYFEGNLIGSVMYSHVPDAYSKAATVINRDRDEVRVLHLPYDSKGYWRSYGWGAFGSSFFHYLIDKPLLEKNFEPGSTENADINGKFLELTRNSQRLSSPEDRVDRAKQFYRLLKKTGTGYVLLDQSISAQVPARSVYFWGDYSFYDAYVLLGDMVKNGEATLVGAYPMKTEEYDTGAQLYLYKVLHTEPKIQALDVALEIDGEQDRQLDIPSDGHYLANTTSGGSVFPFYRRNGSINTGNGNSQSLVISTANTGTFSVEAGLGNQHLVQIFAKKNDTDTVFSLYDMQLPDIGGISSLRFAGDFAVPNTDMEASDSGNRPIDTFLSDWFVLGDWATGAYRLKVDQTFIPVPLSIGREGRYIASVIVGSPQVSVGLYKETTNRAILPDRFKTTDAPNCYGDKLENYQYKVRTGKSLRIESVNGSTCVLMKTEDLSTQGYDYAEFSFHLSGSTTDLDGMWKGGASAPVSKVIGDIPKPNGMDICISPPGISECLNTHHVTDPSAATSLQVPINADLPALGLQVMFSLRNMLYQHQAVDIKDMELHLFEQISEKRVELPVQDEYPSVQLSDRKLNLSFPSALSPHSYYYRKGIDGFTMTNGLCPKGYRTLRKIGDSLTSIVQNCYNEMFVTLPHNSNAFMLWMLRYGLVSGKFPLAITKDKYGVASEEYLSLYQGYPDVRGFKPVAAPELLSSEQMLHSMRSTATAYSYTFLRPDSHLNDTLPKDYIIHQDSENMGVMSVWDFRVIQLPDRWQGIRLVPAAGDARYPTPDSISFSRMLPSLWRLDLRHDTSPVLLKFNEGYDRQWGIYDSLGSVWLGSPVARSVKCDGYANCFQIPMAGSGPYYIFYTPERLSVIGWGITILTLFGVLSFRRLFPRH